MNDQPHSSEPTSSEQELPEFADQDQSSTAQAQKPSADESTSPKSANEAQPSVAVDADSKTANKPTTLSPEMAEKLELVLKQHAEQSDKFLRLHAEFDNYKKRMQREQSDALKYALIGLVRDLLAPLDNLERAIQASGGIDDNALQSLQSVSEGVKMVMSQVTDVFKQHNVEQIAALGCPFDPNLHEAMAMVEADQVPPNHVVTELRKGYILHDRVIRPSMVSVAQDNTKNRSSEQAPQAAGDQLNSSEKPAQSE